MTSMPTKITRPIGGMMTGGPNPPMRLVQPPPTGGPQPPTTVQRPPMRTGGPNPPMGVTPPANGGIVPPRTGGPMPPEHAVANGLYRAQKAMQPDAGLNRPSAGASPATLPPTTEHQVRPVSATGLPSQAPGRPGRPAHGLFSMMSGK